MSDLQDQLAALKSEYLEELPQTARILLAALQRAQANGAVAELEILRNECHKLAGNAAAFEQMDIALVARDLDGWFERAIEAETEPALAANQYAEALEKLASLLEHARA